MGEEPTCRHCGDELPEDCPTNATSCIAYADWRARQLGDMLDEETAKALTLFKFYCAFTVALRDGLEELPHLEP